MSKMIRLLVVISMVGQQLLVLIPPAGAAAQPLDQTERDTIADFVRRLDDLAYFEALGEPIPFTTVTPSHEQALRFGSLFEPLAGRIESGLLSDTYDDHGVSVVFDIVENGLNASLVMAATRETTLPITLSIEDPSSDTPGLCNDFIDNGGDGDADQEDSDCTYIGFYLNGGGVKTKLQFDAEFHFEKADDASLYYLSQPPTMALAINNLEAEIISFTDQLGFTDVEVSSSTSSLNEQIVLQFVDPDSDGRITKDEWTFTAIEDLTEVNFGEGSTVNMLLTPDSNLVDPDGSISLSIDLSQDQDWPAATQVNLHQNLRKFANIDPDEMLAGLASYAVGLDTALLSGEIQLPFLESRFSDVFLPGKPILDLVREQTDALVICGQTDTLPPAGDPTKATTIFCQAITYADPAEVKSWTLAGATLDYSGLLTETVGASPQQNVKFIRQNTSERPRARVEFVDQEGQTHTVFPRVLSAQQLETELNKKIEELTGGGAVLSYDSGHSALMYDITMAMSPPMTTTQFSFADRLRQATNLANLQPATNTKPKVEFQNVVINSTVGAILVDDVAQLAPGSEAGPCDDGEDNDEDGLIDEYDPDCPMSNGPGDRFFIGVKPDPAAYEIEVGDLSLTNAGQVDLEGNIGFLDVTADGPFTIQKREGADPVLGVDILAPEGFTVHSTPPFQIDHAIRTREFLADSGLYDPGEGKGHVNHNINMEMSADLAVQSSPDSLSVLSGTVTIDWDPVNLGAPDITMNDAYSKNLRPFDIAPTIVGVHAGSSGSTELVDESRNFLEDFGGGLQAGDVLSLELFNLTDGSSCNGFIVEPNTLTCISGYNPDGTPVPDILAGGVDNSWDPGDEYEIPGDPQALGNLILDSFYNLASQMKGLDLDNPAKAEFASTLPLIGLSPRDLVTQLDAVAAAVVDIESGTQDAQIVCQPADENETRPGNLFCQAFANVPDITAAKWSLSAGHGVFTETTSITDTVGISPTAYTAFSISVPREERKQFQISLVFTDTAEVGYQATFPPRTINNLSDLNSRIKALLERQFDLEHVTLTFSMDDLPNPANNGSPAQHLVPHLEIHDAGQKDYRLRLDFSDLELTATDPFSTALSLDYRSQAQFDLGIPLTTTISAYDVVVRDTTELTLTLNVADSSVDVEANLGGMAVKVGESAFLTGTHTLERITGTHDSPVSSTTTLTASRDIEALGVVTGTETILTKTGTSITCTVAAIDGNIVTCQNPLSDSGQWDQGDEFELIGPNTKRLHDDRDPNFEDLKIQPGSLVTNITEKAYCQVTDVLTDVLNCEAGLQPVGSFWSEGDEYEVSGEGTISMKLASSLRVTRTLPITGFVGGLEHTFSSPRQAVISATLAIARKEGGPIQVVEVAYGIDDIPDGTPAGDFSDLLAAAEGTAIDWSLLPIPLVLLDDTIRQNLDGRWWNFGLPLVGYDLGAGAEITVRDVKDTLEQPENLDFFGVICDIVTVVNDTVEFIIETDTKNTYNCNNKPPSNLDANAVKNLEITFTISETDKTYSPAFGLGLPGLPVTGEDDQVVKAQATWALTVTFGLSRTVGPYIRAGANDELLLTASVTLPDTTACHKDLPGSSNLDFISSYTNTRCLDAVVGFLPGTLFDKKDEGSSLVLTTTLNLNGDSDVLTFGQLLKRTSAHTVKVDAQADFDVAFTADFDESTDILPIVGTFQFNFDTDGPQDVAAGIQSGWVDELGYKNVYMNPAHFFGGFVGPLVEDVQGFTRPLQPPIDVLSAPVPVLNDLSQALGQGPVSMLTMLETVSGNDLTLLERLGSFISFVNNLPAEKSGVWIGLGSGDNPGEFHLNKNTIVKLCSKETNKAKESGEKNGKKDLKGTNKACVSKDFVEQNWKKKLIDNKKTTESGRDVEHKFAGEARARYSAGGISLPFLSDTQQIYGMLLGIDATLLRADFGSVLARAGFSYSYYTVFVTPVAPIPVEFMVGGRVSVKGRFAMGYDTRGLRHALSGESFTGEALLDGIFLDDYDASGKEVAELSFEATFYAGAAVSIKIVRVGLEIGVTFKVELDLNDPNPDGKMYIDEIMVWRFNPICLFEFTGKLEFFLRMFLEIDLFLFTVEAEWYPFKHEFELFNVKCEPPSPVLANKDTKDGVSVFRLNVGGNAGDRKIYPDEKDEKITVRQLTPVGQGCSTLNNIHEYDDQPGPFKAGPSTTCPVTQTDNFSGTWISVVFQGIKQTFFLTVTTVSQPFAIYADAGNGDDVIQLEPGSDQAGIEVPFELHAIIYGGEGDDRITTGGGNDLIYGDAGNDVINAGLGHDTIWAGPGDDSVDANIGNDLIFGEAGNDILNGGPGIDALDGGPGNDRMTGGPGLSSIFEDELQDKDDILVGGAGNDILEGDYGDNVLFGDTLLGYSKTITDFHLSLVNGKLPDDFREKACQDEGNGQDEGKDAGGQDTLTGGDGADLLFGGPENDSLAGGTGDDYICGNDGHDILDGSRGDDELYGGLGDDQLLGWSGHDLLVGGNGNDLLRGDAGHDALIGDRLQQGGDGSQGGYDALVGGSDNDIMLGDSGWITGTGNLSATNTAAITDVLTSISLIEMTGTGTVSCSLRVTVISGTIDLNGDDVVDEGDKGFFEGYPVIQGKVNLDMDSTITMTDTGFINEILVQEGLVDVNGDGEADENDDGTVFGLAITGTGHADCLFGGDDSDYLFGGPDNDQMFGDAGTDYLEGNGGSDTMRGGQENDRMYGDNTCTGLGPGAQCLPPKDPGGDSMYGDSGDDYMEGNQDVDTMRGGMGTDRMLGGSSATGTDDAGDEMYGDAETDIMLGDNGLISEDGRLIKTIDPQIGGEDTMRGNSGDDIILGGAADDAIWGNPGSDILLGDNGLITRNEAEVVEQIESTYPDQGGVDTIQGNEGPDIILGGTDGDWLAGNEQDDTILGDNGRLDYRANDDDLATLDIVTSISPTSGGMDTISGGFGADLVFGGTDSDNISGDEGHDILLGDHGLFDDSLPPNQNFLAIFTGAEDGGAGDTIHGNDDDDFILGQQGTDHLYGDAGQDDLTGGHNVPGGADDEDMMYGESDESPGTPDGSGADVMIGDNGVISRLLTTTGSWQVNPFNQSYARSVQLYDVELVGEPEIEPGVYGDDKMWGGSNDDSMYGQGGEDIMHGGAGDDTMEGNHGPDQMFGEEDEDDMIGGSSSGPDGLVGAGVPPTNLLDANDVMRGGADDDVMLGDNGLIERQVDSNGIWLRHTGYGFDIVMRETTMAQTPERAGAYGDDDMRGDAGHDDLYGQLGNDYMEGNDGEDAMVGDLGRIAGRIEDGSREQVISVPGPFFEETIYQAGTFSRLVELYAFVEGEGGEGNDIVLGGDGNDSMHGGPGNDIMNGNDDQDRLFGGDGEDILWGGPDRDHLWGGYQDDYLDVRPRPADPAEWFTYGEPDNYQGLDIIYGGWHRDALQADVAAPGPREADRLIDWAGGYNVFYVCPGAYGEGTITRQGSPHLQQFLQDLAEADGALSAAAEGSSGFRELAYVFPNERGQNSHPPHPDHPGHFTCDEPSKPDLFINPTDGQVEARPDLSLAKQANNSFAVPGQTLTYTLTYSNAGDQGATGLVITETVPASTTFSAPASSPGWSCMTGSACVLTVSHLAAGDGGAATFVVTVTDSLLAEMATITNTALISDDGQNGADPTPANNQATDVTPVNFVPAAEDDRFLVDEDSIDNELAVLVNDVDLGGEPLTITMVSTATHGTAVNDLAVLRYTPPADFSGSDQFAYTVSDGVLSDTARVTVTVEPINNPPLAAADTFTLPEDSTMKTLEVMDNDTDPDGDPITITMVSMATHGTVIHNGAQLLYTPAADFHGTDHFTYTVSDGILTATAGVTAVIEPVNDPPVAANDYLEVEEDSPDNVLDVLANDTNLDKDPLTITLVSTTTHGTLINHGTEVSYTPEADFFGSDSFTYTISDGVATGTALVTLSVLPINDPPIAVDDNITVVMDSAINQLDVTDNDIDPDGDILTITLVGTANHGTATHTPISLLYTPPANFTGADYLTYTVSDGLLSNSGTITITVTKPGGNIYLPLILRQ